MPQSAIFSIFDNEGLRLAMTYNGLTMNDPASAVDERIEVKNIRPRLPIRFVSDDRQHSDGAEIQVAHKASLELEMTGRILAPTRAKLYDSCRNVAKRFDPALISRDNPTVRGFLALDGSSPTFDTATHPDGFIEKRIYARPTEPVVPIVMTGGNPQARSTSAEAYFRVNFLARDPRVYGQTELSWVIDAVSEAVTNATADYPSWPSMVMTVASTAGTLIVTNTATDLLPLTIDLSGLDGHVVTVDMENRKITVAGIERPDRYVSGDFFELMPGTNTITFNSVTGLSSSSFLWRPAYSY